MAITEWQKTELERPLHRSRVKQRAQSGLMLSYIEGWDAIDAANRIFGFDGWDRETFEPTLILSGKKALKTGDGFTVSYRARVRITVKSLGVSRDGTGYGSGNDRDEGAAHENAIKEAETDATKRALMTFGHQFGLALYDKDQANVSDDEPPQDEEAINKYCADFYKQIERCKKDEDLKDAWKNGQKTRDKLRISDGSDAYDRLITMCRDRKAVIESAKNAAVQK